MRRTAAWDPTGGWVPPAVKWLLIANGAVFLVEILVAAFIGSDLLLTLFGLRPATVIESGWVWQPLTYMFLHAGLLHLLLNMFVLWMFGAEIERLWGTEEFLKFYVVCGLGAAALLFVFNWSSYTIGASGAVLGVLLAFGMLFPERYIYLYFLIPIKAKWLVAGIAALEVVYLIAGSRGGIANAAHLGGMATAYVWLKRRGAGSGGGGTLEQLAARWRRRKLTLVEGGRGKKLDAETEAEIDRILDKISKHGLDSLTPREERILDEASRRDRE
ncbi:MAG: rhomboid family intramembrane serine protease [Gemmatimonadota bacterium]|nr:rhomboid family intramembrane serine protease [Gemmatimonadota bacterium]